MNHLFGIRREDKYLMERRVAVVPAHLKQLIASGLEARVQSSAKRVFADSDFRLAGAKIVDELNAPVVFGVKEMPLDFFEPDKTYVFFSHVIKGQAYNMPMLQRMIDLKCNLIDYEKIIDNDGNRLIFFGHFAGLAGMINSFWAFGQRMKILGTPNPFQELRQSYQYNSLEAAKNELKSIANQITQNGLPAELTPMIIGFTGYGNVSKGAQEIADLFAVEEISPTDLIDLDLRKLDSKHIYKTVFKEQDLSKRKDGTAFDLETYYRHPELFENKFEDYIPKLSILMNCMYWDDRYPRILTKSYLKSAFQKGVPRLKVIGDVTCDPDGSIECTFKGTEIEDPVFVYNPLTDSYAMGFEGEGILDMAVDILPSELPLESSQAFSDALLPFVKGIVTADYTQNFKSLNLPDPVKNALILHQGELTPSYEYLRGFLAENHAS